MRALAIAVIVLLAGAAPAAATPRRLPMRVVRHAVTTYSRGSGPYTVSRCVRRSPITVDCIVRFHHIAGPIEGTYNDGDFILTERVAYRRGHLWVITGATFAPVRIR